MSKEKIDPEKVQKWIKVVIAVLSALAGALLENATSLIGGFVNLM